MFKVTGIIFFLSFAVMVSTAFAQKAQIAWVSQQRDVTKKFPDVDWPKVSIDAAAFIKSKGITERTGPAQMKKWLLEYCYDYSKRYEAEVKKKFKTDDLGSFFSQGCVAFENSINEEPVVPYQLIPAILNGIQERHHASFYQYSNYPWLTDVKKLEAEIKAYNKTPFAMAGVSYENKELVVQVILIVLLLLGVTGIILYIV